MKFLQQSLAAIALIWPLHSDLLQVNQYLKQWKRLYIDVTLLR